MSKLALALMLALVACQQPIPDPQAVPLAPLSKSRLIGAQAENLPPIHRVITDTATYDSLWTRLSATAGFGAGGPPPDVDFAREMLLVACPGLIQWGRTVTIARAPRDNRPVVWMTDTAR